MSSVILGHQINGYCLTDDAVGDCLLSAIKYVLGDAATEPIMRAWTAAYAFLAKAFIQTEQQILDEMSKQAGYKGFKVRFAIVKNTV